MKITFLLTCALVLMTGSTLAEKQGGKLTCCQQAAADGKECRHKCCAAAHKEGKSCQKCNPNKEDLKKGTGKVEAKAGN